MSVLMALMLSAGSLAGLAGALSVRFRARMVQCFAPAAGLVIAITYASGLAGILFGGTCAALALGVAGWGYCLYTGMRYKRLPEGMGTALLCWAVFFVLSYYANGQRLYGAWDEFSHWGVAVRAMKQTHSLARGAGTVLTFVDYPPATALFAYYLSFLSPKFSEGATYVAMNLLIVSAMLPMLSDFTCRRPLPLLAATLLGALLPALMMAGAYTEIYVDVLLGVLAGMALALFFARRRTRMDEAGFAALLFILTLTKPSGTGLAVIVLLVVLYEALRTKRFGCLLAGGVSVLTAKISWSAYMAVCGHGASWDLGRILPWALGEDQKAIFLRFVRALEEETLFSYWVPVSFVMGLAVFALCAYLFVRMVHKERMGTLTRALVSALLGSALYALSLLLLYMFVYERREGLALASFGRYMTTYLIVLWLFLYALALREGESVRSRVLIGAAVVLMTTGNAGKALYDTASAPIRLSGHALYRQSYAGIGQAAREMASGEKLFIASGLDSMAEWWIARYTAMLPGSALNLPQESAMGGAGAPTAQQWMRMLEREYAYVYVCSAGDAFTQAYGACFEGGIQVQTLYSVDAQRGILVPVA